MDHSYIAGGENNHMTDGENNHMTGGENNHMTGGDMSLAGGTYGSGYVASGANFVGWHPEVDDIFVSFDIV